MSVVVFLIKNRITDPFFLRRKPPIELLLLKACDRNENP